MNQVIRIGIDGKAPGQRQAAIVQDQLRSAGIFSELIMVGDRQESVLENLMEEALLLGKVDMALQPMDQIPVFLPEDVVIAGVSLRKNPAEWLLKRKEGGEEKKGFGLRSYAVIGTSSVRQKAQLLDFRADFVFQENSADFVCDLEKVRQGSWDAMLFAAHRADGMEADLSDLEVVPFSPKEFVPAPAQGVWAYLTCREDFPTRRILQHIHQPEVSARTNIERNIIRLMKLSGQDQAGVYCEYDARGNYHLWAAYASHWEGPVIRGQWSSSTTFQLAEKVAAYLLAG